MWHAGDVVSRNEPGRSALAGIDPRLCQIAILASLLALGLSRYELGASFAQVVVTIAASLGMQAVCARATSIRYDWRSALITGLSLSLLLRTHEPSLWFAAPIIAIGSKFVFRVHGKHLWNPACLAIVVLLLTTHAVWVVPGQWGAFAWGAAALASVAGLVLGPTRRVDMAAAFLAGWSALLAARCLWLGDPWTIPLHQMQSGALLIFAFFMITDPRTTPDSRAGRIVFGLAVAALGHWLQFGWQVREGLFFALAILSLTTPLLDTILPGRRLFWPTGLQPATG